MSDFRYNNETKAMEVDRESEPLASAFLRPYNEDNGSSPSSLESLGPLVENEVEVDTSADATMGRAPVDDGIHEFVVVPIDKSKFGESWGVAFQLKKGEDGKPIRDQYGKTEPVTDANGAKTISYAWALMEYEANDPKQPWDKSHVFESYGKFGKIVNTRIDRGSGTSRVATLLVALLGEDAVPKRATDLKFVTHLVDASQSRPAIALETKWEARCVPCSRVKGDDYKPAAVGQNNFPQVNGKARPSIPCQYNCGNILKPRAKVMHYHPSKSGPVKITDADLPF